MEQRNKNSLSLKNVNGAPDASLQNCLGKWNSNAYGCWRDGNTPIENGWRNLLKIYRINPFLKDTIIAIPRMLIDKPGVQLCYPGSASLVEAGTGKLPFALALVT